MEQKFNYSEYLVKNDLLIGKTKSEVTSVAGIPSEQSDDHFYYVIQKHRKTSELYLRVKFEDDKVVEAKVLQP